MTRYFQTESLPAHPLDGIFWQAAVDTLLSETVKLEAPSPIVLLPAAWTPKREKAFVRVYQKGDQRGGDRKKQHFVPMPLHEEDEDRYNYQVCENRSEILIPSPLVFLPCLHVIAHRHCRYLLK
jgi:hypothetical protein